MKSPKSISGLITILYEDLELCHRKEGQLTVYEPLGIMDKGSWELRSFHLVLSADQARYLLEHSVICSLAIIEDGTGHIYTGNVYVTRIEWLEVDSLLDFQGVGPLNGYDIAPQT